MRFAAASLSQAYSLRPRRRDAARSAVVLRRALPFAPAPRRHAYRLRTRQSPQVCAARAGLSPAPRVLREWRRFTPRPRICAPCRRFCRAPRVLRSPLRFQNFPSVARFAVNHAAFPQLARVLLKRSAFSAFFSRKIFSPLDYFDALATISVIYHRVIR